MADSESEQIIDRGRAAVCQDAIKTADWIASSAKCFSFSPITLLQQSQSLALPFSNIRAMCKTC